MRRSWLDDTGGWWIAHRLKLMVSPAWRHRPIPLVKIIERIEIEHMRHAGKENGHLIVSYDQFERHGVSRRTINPALQLGQALGLLEIRQSGEWSGDIRQPNEYRLTYVPEKDRKAPTDEWEGVENDAAVTLVAEYQKGLSAKQHASAKTCTPPVPKPAPKTTPASAKTDKSPVPERKLSLISGRKAAEPSEQARRERQHTTSAVPAPSLSYHISNAGPVPITDVLTRVLAAANVNISENTEKGGSVTDAAPRSHHPQPSDASTPIDLSEGERSILKWLIGHDGAASHRTTQQAFSGRIKGDEIKAIADALADMSLIRVETEGRARTYVVLEAGRSPALTDDDTQIDLEEYLAGLAGAEH